MQSHIQFEIADLRQQNIQQMMETIGVFVAALILASILPSLLLTYFYKADELQLMTQPPFLVQNAPMIIFGLGMLYFLFGVFSNFSRGKKIKQLKKQLSMMASQPSANEAELAAQQAELAKLEQMVDEALNESEPKSAKKTTKAKKK